MVDIKPIKDFSRSRLPEKFLLRKLLLSEKDDMNTYEFLYKAEGVDEATERRTGCLWSLDTNLVPLSNPLKTNSEDDYFIIILDSILENYHIGRPLGVLCRLALVSLFHRIVLWIRRLG